MKQKYTLRASYMVEAGFLYPVCIFLTVSLILCAAILSEQTGREAVLCTKQMLQIRQEAYTPIAERNLLTGPIEALNKGADAKQYCVTLAKELKRDVLWPISEPVNVKLSDQAVYCATDLPYSEMLYLRYTLKLKNNHGRSLLDESAANREESTGGSDGVPAFLSHESKELPGGSI